MQNTSIVVYQSFYSCYPNIVTCYSSYTSYTNQSYVSEWQQLPISSNDFSFNSRHKPWIKHKQYFSKESQCKFWKFLLPCILTEKFSLNQLYFSFATVYCMCVKVINSVLFISSRNVDLTEKEKSRFCPYSQTLCAKVLPWQLISRIFLWVRVNFS